MPIPAVSRSLKRGQEFLEPAGDPAITIEQIADQGGFDTVILGSRGLGVLSRATRGSVSEHVATDVHATTIIVH